jgi:hypothetical protein
MSASSSKSVNSRAGRHSRRVVLKINGEVNVETGLAGDVEDGSLTPRIYGSASAEGRRVISLQDPPTRTWRTRLVVRIRTRPIGTVSVASCVDGGRASPPSAWLRHLQSVVGIS